jgi:hypothetical protein
VDAAAAAAAAASSIGDLVTLLFAFTFLVNELLSLDEVWKVLAVQSLSGIDKWSFITQAVRAVLFLL